MSRIDFGSKLSDEEPAFMQLPLSSSPVGVAVCVVVAAAVASRRP